MRYEPENSLYGKVSLDMDTNLQKEKIRLATL